jgi:hypothetical protein
LAEVEVSVEMINKPANGIYYDIGESPELIIHITNVGNLYLING